MLIFEISGTVTLSCAKHKTDDTNISLLCELVGSIYESVNRTEVIVEKWNSFSIYPIQFNVYGGWNLVSIPILVANMSKLFLFPTAISPVYAYDNGYYTVDTLLNGEGYWVKFNSNETISLPGNFVTENLINVSSGWNMIGPFGNTIDVNSIITQPPDLLESPFYGFGSGYYIANTLEPGKGYWIKTNASGILYLDTNLGNDKLHLRKNN